MGQGTASVSRRFRLNEAKGVNLLKMKLLLIVPRAPGGGGTLAPNLGIITLAALTPPDIEVSVVDENVEEIDLDAEVDLVGITAMTPTAVRAYKIADEFRKRGRAVVMGGFHPSTLPEEAIQHSDSVVIGEAEEVWMDCLHDFESGRLRRFYKQRDWSDLHNLPIPRRDLLKAKRYVMFNTVETARGCPFRCHFCSVSSHFGNAYRFRPVRDVVAEVETIKGKYLFFVDDNIVATPRRAKELFLALAPCRKKWIGQASLTIARDENLVKLIANSGSVALFMGFESLSQESLREAHKSFNVVNRYEEIIKMMHAHGISVHGAFIFGFDHDDETIFKRTVEFAVRTRLDTASFSALTPFPGTPLYRKLSEENRIFTEDWAKYGGVVFQPKSISPEVLDEGCRRAWKECYSYKSILRRLPPLKRYWPLRLLVNLGFKKFVRGL